MSRYLPPMASSLDMRPGESAPGGGGANAPDLHAFEHHWQDEADAAFLYRALADVEPDSKKQDVYRRLATLHRPSCLLESGKGNHPHGRYSFIATDPYLVLAGKDSTYVHET